MKTIFVWAIVASSLVASHVAFAQTDDEAASEEPAQQQPTDAQDAPDEERPAAKTQAPTPRRTAKASATRDFRIVYAPPGCMNDTGSTDLSLVTALFEHFKTHRGKVFMSSSGPSAMSNGTSVVFPEGSVTDATVAPRASDETLNWEVVEENIPALVNPYEILVQHPFRGHFDWLSLIEKKTGPEGMFAGTRRVSATLYRASVGEQAVLKLELDDPEVESEPLFVRQFAATAELVAPDDEVTLYMLGKSLGRGSRIKPQIDALMEASDAPTTILLHPGGIANDDSDPKARELCGDLVKHLNPMAIVPRESELSLGVAGLNAYARQHGLRYVAANLRSRASGEPPFRRFSILNVDGLTVAVIGIVSDDQLAHLPASVRDEWEIDDPNLALARARDELAMQLQRRPDLTVVLLSTREGRDFARIASVSNVDTVIGPFNRFDLVPLEEHYQLDPSPHQNRKPAVTARGNPYGVGEIVVGFEERDDAIVLQSFAHRIHPVGDQGPIDVHIEELFQPIRAREAGLQSQVLLPDVAPIVENDESLEPLVHGTRILRHRDWEAVEPSDPIWFSDALWMRFVTNVLRARLDAEVAISRNLPRTQKIPGPLPRWLVDAWLPDTDEVRVVELTGAQLAEIAQRARRQFQTRQIPVSEYIFLSGLDPESLQIDGRRLEPNEPYRVVVTDFVASLPDLQEIFVGQPIDAQFVRDGEHFDADAEGSPLSVEEVVLTHLEEWQGSQGHFDPQRYEELATMLEDASQTRSTQLKLSVRELSARAALYQNTDNIENFAATRETRLTTPDNFSVGGKADVSLLLDTLPVAWETGVDAVLDRMELDVPGHGFWAQERADDVVAFTELRLNALSLQLSDEGVPLVPFVRTEFDTEFTATVAPTADGAAAETFPHQKLIKLLAGTVVFPGPRLSEVRLSPVAQFDLSEADTDVDFGVRTSYVLTLPFSELVRFQSASSVEYLVPDGDDRPSDLALRLISENKLLFPLWEGLSLYAFGDVYFALGKTDANNQLGGSYFAGGGLHYADIFKF